jgi:hypothetical protein
MNLKPDAPPLPIKPVDVQPVFSRMSLSDIKLSEDGANG